MKPWIFYVLLSFEIVFLVSCRQDENEGYVPSPAPASRDDAVAVVQAPAQDAPSPPELHYGMALLDDHDVAFALDAKQVTWGEFKAAVSSQLNLNDVRGLNEKQINLARRLVFNNLRKRILLANAVREGFSVSGTDQDELNAIIRQQLALQSNSLTLEQYLDSFPPDSDSFMQLSRAEMYLLMKYTREMTKDITVSDDEVKMLLTQAKQIYENIHKQNQQLRQDLEALLKLPEINTDQGFAELARAHSQGREASRGGELNVYYTRSELKEANDDQEITIGVGANTGLIETQSAYRIIRLLQEMPPEEPGMEVRYRIAQILQMKYAEDEIPSGEDLRRSFQYQKEEDCIQNLTLQSIVDYNIQCPLFPSWEVKRGL